MSTHASYPRPEEPQIHESAQGPRVTPAASRTAQTPRPVPGPDASVGWFAVRLAAPTGGRRAVRRTTRRRRRFLGLLEERVVLGRLARRRLVGAHGPSRTRPGRARNGNASVRGTRGGGRTIGSARAEPDRA
ncbi:hypothetical protein DRB89_42460 [Streptomyces sp. ICC4]|nr:hypothetical protein DRB89_42460 [Streptomyces sp. ICC4]